ncbi:hypothetical protein BGX34_011397 [Mortierella sp. NVP85]|nr:hypothetical protein BGX34_011397 [Mortierella sp. NVP85]
MPHEAITCFHIFYPLYFFTSESTSINAKMNIFYVLDSICHQSYKAGFSGYIDLIQRNLAKIVECVTPNGPKGNVNVPGTKKILESWRAKKVFPEIVIDKVEKPLSSRELGISAAATVDSGFTKDDILKRMDEDRERHKRIREEIWIRPSDEDPFAEFLQNWEEVSELDDNDYEDMDSENEKYLAGYPWPLEFDRFLPSPGIFKHKALSSANTETTADPGAVAIKRLTSPEGTVTVSNLGGTKVPTAIPATSHQHNGHAFQSGRDNPRSYGVFHSSHHQYSQTHHAYSSTFNSHARTQHHERKLSNSTSTQTGYANGYGGHVP